jgi:SAM-dependent methyltransferase
MNAPSPYAPPRLVTDLAECYFYHTTELPGIGVVEGEWDLRANLGAYLGQVNVAGKRVLDLGTASGFLTFAMERMGAEVVGYDLSEEYEWDIVPYAGVDLTDYRAARREHIRRLNNSWWLTHRLLGSRARVVYGTVYAIPEAIGPVDICTVGAILQHLRDPFLALQQALRLTRELVIVTDPPPPGYFAGRHYRVWYARLWRRLPVLHSWMTEWPRAEMISFLPEPTVAEPKETWWLLAPETVIRMVGVLGFEPVSVTFHHQQNRGRNVLLYTVVARRVRGEVVGEPSS